MFEEIQHYCPAHKACKELGNFTEKNCKYSNNQERRMTFHCAAGIIFLLKKVLDGQGGQKK